MNGGLALFRSQLLSDALDSIITANTLKKTANISFWVCLGSRYNNSTNRQNTIQGRRSLTPFRYNSELPIHKTK